MARDIPTPLQVMEIASYGLMCPKKEMECRALLNFIHHGNSSKSSALTKDQRINLCKIHESLRHKEVIYKNTKYKVTFVGPSLPADEFSGNRTPDNVGEFFARLTKNPKHGYHSITAPVSWLEIAA